MTTETFSKPNGLELDIPGSGSFVRVLAKALAVMRTFSERPQATISDVANATGLDRAGARRILLTLEQLGYVRIDHKKFSLTPRVLELGYGYLSSLPFRAVAQPVMEELVNEINETCTIGVLDVDDVVFVFRVPARRLLSFDAQVGSHVPAYVHSIGRILLGDLPEDQLDAYLERVELRPLSRRTISSKEELARSILHDREAGWCFLSEQYEEGLCGVAVPIFDAAGRSVAAIDVSFDAGPHAKERAMDDILPKLRLASRRMRQQLR